MDELKQILDTMDVPKFRKDNLRWLSRNLAIRNSNHPDFEKAKQLITKLSGEDNILVVG